MYAIIITEAEYPCGNVYGIFDSIEKAEKSVKNIIIDDDNSEIKIVKFELNKLIEGSLTGCADCMTCVKLIN